MDVLKRFILFFATAFACLYLTYSPTVTIPYVNHDSIRYFHKFYNHASEADINPQYGFSYSLGRPLQAELAAFLYKCINHLSDMSRLRLAVIVICALSAAMLGVTLVSMGVETLAGFCLSTAVFTLPGVQESVFVPYLNNALSALVALLAFYIWRGRWIAGPRFIMTLALLVLVFLAYPPSTFFFLLPAAFVSILRVEEWSLIRRKCFEAIVLWLAAAVVYYIVLKVSFYGQLKFSHHEINFSGQQVLADIGMFFPFAVPQIFNLWDIYYSKGLGLAMMALAGIFLVMDFGVFRKPWGWQRLLLIVTVFILCNMIWFIFDGYLPRTFVVAQAMAMALIYANERWVKLLCKDKCVWVSQGWPLVLLAIGLIWANKTLTQNVWNNNAELMFVRDRLVRSVDSSTREIHIVLLKDNGKGYNGLPIVYDNFNGSTPDYEIPDLIRVALKDLPDPFELHCQVTVSGYGQPYALAPNNVVIDMNDLAYIAGSRKQS